MWPPRRSRALAARTGPVGRSSLDQPLVGRREERLVDPRELLCERGVHVAPVRLEHAAASRDARVVDELESLDATDLREDLRPRLAGRGRGPPGSPGPPAARGRGRAASPRAPRPPPARGGRRPRRARTRAATSTASEASGGATSTSRSSALRPRWPRSSTIAPRAPSSSASPSERPSARPIASPSARASANAASRSAPGRR